jgi:hypothetical protein
MALLFGIGYAGIIFEESLAFNKSGVGLLMAVSLWVVRSIGVRFFLASWNFQQQIIMPNPVYDSFSCDVSFAGNEGFVYPNKH